MSIHEAVSEFRSAQRARQDRPADVWGLPTGFPAFDRRTGGLHPTEVTVLGGRTGMGKTAGVLHIVGTVCDYLVRTRDPRVVLFISAEMSRTEIVRRLASAHLGLSIRDLMSGRLVEADQKRLDEFLFEIARTWPLDLRDPLGPSLDDVSEMAASLAAGWKPTSGEPSPIALLIVDHIGKVRVRDSRGRMVDNEYAAQTEVADRLARAARNLRCPVIEVAQINRGVETRLGALTDQNLHLTKPGLSDLRGSGRIEDNAHNVLLFWRAGHYQSQINQTEDTPGPLLIQQAKGRNSGTGTEEVHFNTIFTRIEPWKKPRVLEDLD